jgi:hypothetical protein
MKTTMIAVFVSLFLGGCYDSWADQCDGEECGREDFPVVTCEIAVTTNAIDGATVTVDGVETGTTVELTMGSHTFAATAAGYFPVSVVAEVAEACAPVELRLLPNLNGWYDFVLHGRTYYRFMMQIRQDEASAVFAADIWREGTSTSEHPYQHFAGAVSYDRDVDLLSEDSSEMYLWGGWTPPRREGVARIEGAYDYFSGEGGDWVAESRP